MNALPHIPSDAIVMSVVYTARGYQARVRREVAIPFHPHSKTVMIHAIGKTIPEAIAKALAVVPNHHHQDSEVGKRAINYA